MINHKLFLEFRDYVAFNLKEGPQEKDYLDLTKWIFRVHAEGGLIPEQLAAIFPSILWENTVINPSLFNRIFNAGKIAGTWDIMDEIYSNVIRRMSPLEQRWDRYIQSQVSALAVRHRPIELSRLLQAEGGETCSVLDVACGSGMAAKVVQDRLTNTRYCGIDTDHEAITTCLKRYPDPAFAFIRQGLTYNLKEVTGLFDIVWCSGLFDYFSDPLFIRAAKSLIRTANKHIMIGNMGPSSPTIPMMDMLGWKLCYRTKPQLHQLAEKLIRSCGRTMASLITSDPTGTQHYLHLMVDQG